MSKPYEEIEKERAQRIEKHISNKDLNIRVSWAINNAVEIASAVMSKDNDTGAVKGGIRDWSRWFLEYYEELRKEEAEKLVGKEDDEKPL